jgi:glutathione S-transferase
LIASRNEEDVMKLHWSPRSPYVRKVMVFAYETGLADRLERVRSVVMMSKPNRELMRTNPLGKIPTLVTDDGRILFDSIVICEYLDTLHAGPKLFPASGAERWPALRWHALADGMLDTLILWRNEREQPPAQQNPDWLSTFDLKIRNSLDVIERETPELERAPLNIGHVAIACALGYLDFRFPDLRWRDGHTRSAAWFAKFAERPSVKLTAPVDE